MPALVADLLIEQFEDVAHASSSRVTPQLGIGGHHRKLSQSDSNGGCGHALNVTDTSAATYNLTCSPSQQANRSPTDVLFLPEAGVGVGDIASMRFGAVDVPE